MHVSDCPLNRYQVHRQWWTAEDTKASFWDSSLPGGQDETLDDGELRKSLASVVRHHPHHWQLVPGPSA